MKRVRIQSAGGYDAMALESVPTPTPGPGEVLVEAAACGVNYADCIVRMGLYSSAKTYVGWPITPGFEVAGEVVAVGNEVTDVAAGDRVMAVTRFGGYASHVCVDARQVFPVPDGLSLEQAAGFPAVFLTAWWAMFELARPRPGRVLLVHSAAGGVGGALCQLGSRVAECDVVGVVGKRHKVPTAEAQGACAVVVRDEVGPRGLWRALERAAPGGYHVVFDANGVATLRASYDHLASPGKLVVYGFATMLPRGRGTPSWPKLAVDWLRTPRFDPLDMTTRNRSVLAFNLSYLFDELDILGEAMDELCTWLADGRLQPQPVQTFGLDRVADAHRAIEGGDTVGKLVLVP